MKKHLKNEEHVLRITDIGTNGEGIGHLDDGYTLFVKGALPGDVVKAVITRAQKNYAYARVAETLEASPDRVTPPCPNAGRCGGCQVMHLSYEAQLRYKENKVRELLTRVGGLDPGEVSGAYEGIIGHNSEKAETTLIRPVSEDAGDWVKAGSDPDSYGAVESALPIRYRNKAQYPVGTDRDGRLVTGFYAIHSHRIIPCTDCLIGAPTDAPILDAVRTYMTECGVSAYDETTQKGMIRHILIRTGFATGEIQACLVINGKKLPHADKLVSALLGAKLNGQDAREEVPESGQVDVRNPHVVSICTNANIDNTNVIMGEEVTTLYGKDHITDMIGELEFHVSPLSFYQVNPVQTRKLYAKALQYAGLTGSETVWDLYCGIGTISLFLARAAGRVYGVEVVPEAIDDARANARINGLDNTEFIVGRAEDVLPRVSENSRPDVIVVDPPRKGCDVVCLDTMLAAAPERFIYVSCDPATLARDLKYLCENGPYHLSKYACVDMFPNSVHVETVVCLSKGSTMSGGHRLWTDRSGAETVKSKKIRVEFSLEDMDTDGFKKGATYNAIRDWIKEKYGYRVTNLNIAQVKQKHGIIERENYNKPKSPDSKQPGCPGEKVKAIEDAMRHFKMI